MNLRFHGSTFPRFPIGVANHGGLRRTLLKVAYGKAAVGDIENGGGGSAPRGCHVGCGNDSRFRVRIGSHIWDMLKQSDRV